MLPQDTKHEAKVSPGQVVFRDSTGREKVLYKGSYALFIGMSNYKIGWSLLPGVQREAEVVKRVLESHGFSFEARMDLDKLALDNEISEFISKYGSDPENRILIFFAGHGYTVRTSYGEEQGYFVPIDAPHPTFDLSGFRNKSIEEAQIGIYAKRIESKHVLFIFDACFSGSLFAQSRSSPASLPAIIDWKISQPVRQFITSGSADEVVPDNDLFCSQFERALRGDADVDRDGYITGTDLGEYLQRSILQYTSKQHPQYGKIRNPNLDKGDFVFALNKESSLRQGRLFINSHPDSGEIFIDGKSINQRTPSEILNSAEGSHTIEVRRGNLYGRRSVVVSVDELNKTDIALEPGKGNIILVSIPADADVYINDRPMGKTPLPLDGLAAGLFSFRMRRSGYLDFKGSANVIPDSSQTFTAKLVVPASLSICSIPPGADVEIRGNAIGKTPLNVDSLPPGPVTLKISSSEFLTYADTINIVEGRSHHVDASLRSKYASLALSSSYQGHAFSGLPLGTTVLVDGKTVSQDSLSYLRVQEGEHILRILDLQYLEPLEVRFRAAASEQKRIQVTFGTFTFSSLWRSALVPGWGQLYAGSKTGWAYLFASIGAGASIYLTQRDYSTRLDHYDAAKLAYSGAQTNADAERLRADMQEMYSKAKKANDLRTVAAAASVVVYTVNLIDALLLHSHKNAMDVLENPYVARSNPTLSYSNKNLQFSLSVCF